MYIVLYMDIADLRADPENPRNISSQAAVALRKALEEFGDLSGIVWNKRTGELVGGHQRVTLLREMGATYNNGSICVKGKKLAFPVRVVDWAKKKQRRANLAANSQELQGRFSDGLADVLRAIQQDGDDLADLRFDDLAKSFKVKLNMPGEVEQDDIPEPPEAPVTQDGDTWKLGEHTLFCGDARGVDYGEIDCVFTDPPYGVNYQSRVDEKRRKNWGKIQGDDLSGDGLSRLLGDTIPQAEYRYICAPWDTLPVFFQALGVPKSVCVWDKGWFGLGNGYRRQFELVLFYGKLKRADLSDVWSLPRARDYKHPTQKPVALVAKALSDCGATSVYDPFGGSGTTIIAAEQLGVRCKTVEIEPKYCDVIVERWELLTGKEATRG